MGLVVVGVMSVARGDTDPAEARSLIRQLGNRSYRLRVEAQRKLIALGPVVIDELNAAADKEGGEIAIRAREIVTGLSRQLLAGVKVTLEGPVTSIRWNEPAPLTVVMKNESAHVARVPFFPADLDPARPSVASQQAAHLIDLADFLVVTGPDDRPLDLYVNDIKEMPALNDAVNARLETEAVRTLGPGETLRVELPAMNRGWARYRLLERGSYRVKLKYVPAWTDEALRTAGVGVVTSNRITVRVKKSAPESIRRASRPIRAGLTRLGDQLVVDLISTSDMLLHVNTLVGQKLGRSAVLTWVVRAGDKTIEIKSPAVVDAASKPIDKTLLPLKPAEQLRVASIPVAKLLSEPAIQSLEPGTTFTVEARYLNQFSRSMITDTPKAIRDRVLPPGRSPDEYAASLPAPVFTGMLATNQIELTKDAK